MAIRTAEYWDEKAQAAKEKAEAITDPLAKSAMLTIAQHYQQIADSIRKAIAALETRK